MSFFSLNKVMIIGNVGLLPEMRYTPSGKETVRFRVATNRRWTGNDGATHDETQWFTVIAWGKLADTCNRLITNKGAKIYVEGRLQTRSWEGQDGQKRFATEVVAENVIFLDSRPKEAASESEAGDIDANDLPFSDDIN